ncbi:protein PYRICULARIA ORYZAE RESISTANCE 21-like [Pistacia vera]|uniref:protein PYRICULARIA ORYZAE RESISTANCE 21-like n=1 Tax=Pistacia vera TaxID=55513 RepID=UPI001262D168|nr:protein PYRICULARIA ORYZAE RESISTANCE 21-like [Pistacia vera]
MAEVTTMVIKVDLKCCKCYKKVKKVLCKIPQIKDQVYDEKQNTVTIKVACCYSPEKILQKIRCKGGKSILSIEIKPPPKKPEEPKKPQEKPKEPTKPHPCGGSCEQIVCGRTPCSGRPVCDSWVSGCNCGCNRGYYCRNRCGYYNYCEEPCSIM